jgi:hypothetical protein
MVNIILVHAGDSPAPTYLRSILHITHKVAPRSRITVLANANQEAFFQSIGQFFHFAAIEGISKSAEHSAFLQTSALNRDFRGGFWLHTTSRFFVLADYIRQHSLENVVHFENDVVPYFDPADKLLAFQSHAPFSVPLDRNRAIASIVWIANSGVAASLSQHLATVPANNDMEALNQFCLLHPDIAKPLPTLPSNYAKHKGLDLARFCQGIETFGGVFDAAAIGQYVGGVDPQNNPHNSRFFINESSDMDMREIDFGWDVSNGVRSPSLRGEHENTKLLCLHAHSKDIEGISPFNHAGPYREEAVITGERLQALADLTISAPTVTQFHGVANIQSPRRLDIPQNEQGQLLVPPVDFIASCQSARVIFVYTHLLEYFKHYIAPRLKSPFVLISHNSDHAVGFEHLELLNHPHLVQWWAQNCEIAHSKLMPLPIGLANRQWGTQKIEQLVTAAQLIDKTKLLYANIGMTHPSRVAALRAAEVTAGVTIASGVDYPTYLQALASHKFCLCPRGNGIDSHRFWEAQYLQSIPVIVKADWTSAFSELPTLVLDAWEQLPSLDLQKEYIRISSAFTRFDRLSLSYYRTAFNQSLADMKGFD